MSETTEEKTPTTADMARILGEVQVRLETFRSRTASTYAAELEEGTEPDSDRAKAIRTLLQQVDQTLTDLEGKRLQLAERKRPSLQQTRESLWREIGRTPGAGKRGDSWQPMVAAYEVRMLLEALDRRDQQLATARRAVDALAAELHQGES